MVKKLCESSLISHHISIRASGLDGLMYLLQRFNRSPDPNRSSSFVNLAMDYAEKYLVYVLQSQHSIDFSVLLNDDFCRFQGLKTVDLYGTSLCYGPSRSTAANILARYHTTISPFWIL